MQVKNSFSMVASLLSSLTIGAMITCIVSVVILSYQKNILNKLDNDPDIDVDIPVKTYDDFSSSKDMAWFSKE